LILEQVTIPSNNVKSASVSMTLEPNTSLDLYDIDENDFEYEHDPPGPEVDNSFSRDLQHHPFGYPTFSPSLSQQHQLFGHSNFADPFHPSPNFNDLHAGSFLNLGETVEQHFHAGRQQQPQHLYFNDVQQPIQHFFNPCLRPSFNQIVPQAYNSPAFVPIPSMTPLPAMPTPIAVQQPIPNSSSKSDVSTVVIPTDCSVCLASKPLSLAILQPCGHPLCSVCLTSALNIVGEKDMECAVCKQGVADFRLVTTTQAGNANSKTRSRGIFTALIVSSTDEVPDLQQTSEPFRGVTCDDKMMPPIDTFQHGSIPDNSAELDSAFEFGLDLEELRASTPKTEQQVDRSRSLVSNGFLVRESGENVVLRIDNVPWVCPNTV
jgi:hypothetical protein